MEGKQSGALEEILARLKRTRKERFFTQEEVARKLMMSRTTYLKKEKGLIPITTDEWIKLSKIMKINLANFFLIRSKKKLFRVYK